MLALTNLQENPEYVTERLKARGVLDAAAVVAAVLELNGNRKSLLMELDGNRSEMNKIAKQVGAEMAKGNKEAAEHAKQATQHLKFQIAEQEGRLSEVERRLDGQLVLLPNTPHDSVPTGRSAEDNVIVFQNTTDLSPAGIPKPIPHWEVARQLDIVDWETGVKITGSGFPLYRGKGARLQRALINFFLDEAAKAGYVEHQPPIMVNEASAYATGQLPDKEGQMYHVTADDLYLIPTAEVPLTNIYRDVILDEAELPVKLCGYTPCFRREAGSYGKDVRGLNRLHQFDKVEIVHITTPERSYNALEEMAEYVRGLLEKLGLTYRTALLCTGDMGFTSAKTYDMEVYSTAQARWLEVSSVSNFETFQANRLKLRYRPLESKKTVTAHTLNGSALALPRIVACLLEHYQLADGGVRMPECLAPYTGFEVLTA